MEKKADLNLIEQSNSNENELSLDEEEDDHTKEVSQCSLYGIFKFLGQYDYSSIERQEAKLKFNRLKDEKQRMNYNALVRERDLLRDWTKRTELKQCTDYEQAYTAYNSTVKNNMRSS